MIKGNRLTKANLVILAGLAIITLLSSCTKNREVRFPHGAGENLLSISDYDGKEFNLSTENEISQLASSQSDQIKENNTTIKNYNIVKYTTTAELMDDTAFVGRSNHTYKIKYVLTDNYLKVYKISKKEDLSINELTSAEAINNGLEMQVPLLGYPVIGYYRIEKSRNNLNEETSSLSEKKLETKSGATHFRIDKQAKQIFKSIQKADTFPASFFDGDWYYAETITATNYANQSNYAANLSIDKFGNQATKVRLIKTENALNFVNLNIDNELKSTLSSRTENQVNVISVPATWKEYKQSDLGKDKGLTEEENSDLNWQTRKFVKINLQQAKSTLLQGSDTEVLDIQISEKYFSFVSFDKSTNSKFRHSFYKAEKNSYISKTYFSDDRNKFGYFYSLQNKLDSAKIYYEKDQEKLYFVNRFDPAKKVIEFHLSDVSPAWSDSIAKKATESWNEAFKKAGLLTTIKFNPNRVQLGDLRYNVLNLIDQPDDNFSWGGYGPSVTDPQTGEIISSTANVNLNDSTNLLVEIMRRMADSKRGYLDKAYVLGSPLPSYEPISTNDDSVKNLKQFSNLQQAVNNQLKNDFKIQLPIFDKKNSKGFSYLKDTVSERKNSRLQFAPEKDLSISFGNIIEDVNKNCADVKSYIDNLTPIAAGISSEAEYKLYQNCALKISSDKILSVLLHEMGHNFGLRHNFYGSVDVANFISKTARTSSVMEYTTVNEERSGIGSYDIAAIMWGYNDQIETSNGKIKIDTLKSINQNISEKNVVDKKYSYCSDEHVDLYAIDPLCARLDAGTTPVEIVTNKIIDYNSSIAIGNQKRNRAKLLSAQEASMARFDRYVLPIKKFYDFWRFQVSLFAGSGQDYLENYDEQQYIQLIEKMKADPKFKHIVEKYKPAADLAFNFLTEIAFLPDYYCLTQREVAEIQKTENNKEAYKLFSLSVIKNDIFEKTGQTVSSCKSPEVITYLKNKKATVIGQGGYYLNDQFNDLSVQKTIDSSNVLEDYRVKLKPDQLGNIYDRAFAFGLLSSRYATSIYNQKLGFYPNFYDEPTYRNIIETKLLNRVINGVDINSLRLADAKSSGKLFSLNFVEEKDLLNYFFENFKQGYLIPGNTKENNDRLNLFQINFSYDSQQLNSMRKAGLNIVTTEILGNTYYATEKNQIAFKLLSAVDAINNLKSVKKPSEQIIDAVVKKIGSVLPNNETIKTMSVKEYLKISEAFTQLSVSFFKNKTSHIEDSFLERVSGRYTQIERYISLLMKKNKIIDPDAVEKFRQRNLLEVASEIQTVIDSENEKISEIENKIPQLNIAGIQLENLDNHIKETISIGEKVYEVYKNDEIDFDAQSNILINALTGR